MIEIQALFHVCNKPLHHQWHVQVIYPVTQPSLCWYVLLFLKRRWTMLN